MILDIVGVLTNVLAWSIVIAGAIYLYRKNQEEMAIWKIAFVILLGLFTLDFHYGTRDQTWEIPLLPLGVWILYFFNRHHLERWQRIRHFAWWGFWSSFLFTAVHVLYLWIHPLFFPPEEFQTHVAEIENAEIITLHPSAEYISFDPSTFSSAIETAENRELNVWKLHEDHYFRENNPEIFPYLLDNTKAKWGSGFFPAVYLHKDGHGILVDTAEKEYYFETEKPLWE